MRQALSSRADARSGIAPAQAHTVTSVSHSRIHGASREVARLSRILTNPATDRRAVLALHRDGRAWELALLWWEVPLSC